MQAYNQQQLLAEAEQCGLLHLRELGVSLLSSMSPALEAWCFGVDPADERSYSRHPVLSSEPMSAPMDILIMQVLSSLVPSMFVLPSSPFASLVITMLQHTMTRGSSPDAGLSFACMGIVLFPSNQLALAFAMGQVGKLLLATFGDAGRNAVPRADTVHYGLVFPWCRRMADCYALEVAAIDDAIMINELAWGNWQLGQRHRADAHRAGGQTDRRTHRRTDEQTRQRLPRRALFKAHSHVPCSHNQPFLFVWFCLPAHPHACSLRILTVHMSWLRQ